MTRGKANPLDLRIWREEMRSTGELKDVIGADWNLELGAISELNVRRDSNPALLFDEVVGYPKGFRVLTCTTSSPARLSSVLQLGEVSDHHSLVQKLRGKPAEWQGQVANYDPVVTESGPVLENVCSGKTLDLEIFPSPLWHEHDGGRYIATG